MGLPVVSFITIKYAESLLYHAGVSYPAKQNFSCHFLTKTFRGINNPLSWSGIHVTTPRSYRIFKIYHSQLTLATPFSIPTLISFYQYIFTFILLFASTTKKAECISYPAKPTFGFNFSTKSPRGMGDFFFYDLVAGKIFCMYVYMYVLPLYRSQFLSDCHQIW